MILPLFISPMFWDLVDILFVALLMFQVYKLIRGTAALNIFVGIFVFYLAWLFVKALNMEMVSTILGQFMGVGVIALIIVFQQEVRRFLLLIGTKYNINNYSILDSFFKREKSIKDNEAEAVVAACCGMSATKTGALIVISKNSELYNYAKTGVMLKCLITVEAIESIFFKNAPLHDGAVILANNKILAARVILPVSDSMSIPGSMGLRHRAAVGITEHTDAHVITVSEESGRVSYIMGGEIMHNLSIDELREVIEDPDNKFSQNTHK